MKKIIYLLYSFSILLTYSSCNPDRVGEVSGYAPVYASDSNNLSIRTLGPQPIINAGKIYVKGSTLYQVENGQGIHVINISDPAHPEKMAFIEVNGAQEISIQDNFLYTNSFNDLLILSINNLQDVQVANRVANTFTLQESNRPPEPGYFECPDPNKGTVIGWKKTILQSPRCKY